MTWIVWRQYRLQGAIALALLALFAAAELTTGFQMASAWHAQVASCGGTAARNTPPGFCQGGVIVSKLGNDLRVLSVLVPALAGILLGAPLVAHEIETGTTSFAWTQGVTRTRWLLVRSGWLLLAAAVAGAAVSALVTFWSAPVNAMRGDQFSGNFFDTQGLVPAAYAVFATALGIAAGALLRRTLPAIAVTLGAFIGVRILIADQVRPHLMPAVTTVMSMTSTWTPPGIAWVFGSSVISSSGQALNTDIGVNGLPLTDACAKLLPPAGNPVATAALKCMQSAGFRQAVTYQPSWRYWPFQGIESGIYLVLAAALVAVAWYALRRRDA